MKDRLRNERYWWDRTLAEEADGGSREEVGDTLVDWDPWWPVTAKPRALRMEGTELEGQAQGPVDGGDDDDVVRLPRDSGTFPRSPAPSFTMRTVGPHTDEPTTRGPSIEAAMLRVEGVLSSATLLSAGTRAEQIAVALLNLTDALRRPRDVLEELLYEVGSTLALNSLARMERIFEDLARRAEELAVEAEYRGFRETRLAARQLLRETDAALAVEVDTVVDVYWLDAGVVD